MRNAQSQIYKSKISEGQLNIGTERIEELYKQEGP